MDDFTRQKSVHELWDSSQLAGENAAYLESLYEQYLLDPGTLSGAWRRFFDTLPRVNGQTVEVAFRSSRRYASTHPA